MENEVDNKITTNDSTTVWDRVKDNIYYQSKKIVVRQSSPEMGLGVFATEDIAKNEVIERSAMIQLQLRRNYVRDIQLLTYTYVYGCECEECKNHGVYSFLVLGNGMLYNHRDKPNAAWDFNYYNLIGDLIAEEDIKKDEEIFVHYGDNYFTNKNKSKNIW